MKSYKIIFSVENDQLIINQLRDNDFFLSIIPYQVERGKNAITLRFKRFALFSFKDQFIIEGKTETKNLITYTFKSKNGNSLEFYIANRVDKNQLVFDLTIQYSGEKEWIVRKYLRDIAESMERSIKDEIKKIKDRVISTNLSENLGKLSFLAKLLMKSRIVKSEEIDIIRSQAVEVLSQLIQDYLRYRLIYISGTSNNSTFRVLFVDGNVSGVYVNINGNENYGEQSLNELEGHFKVNIYVSLVPEEILKGVLNEGS
ncbi:hypothetical protein SJAV_18710 [Sulfurisphaera javensis]|uniref:Uncharacterized protein n=1 Tax=Sulfurisphaera javensis TaxID=2049879 RepID=A0AAT9GTI3_9CREN